MTGAAPLPALFGRRVHVAGSASAKTSSATRAWAHGFVRAVTRGIIARGGGLVLASGKEPVPAGEPSDAPSLVFDWTALAEAEAALTTDGTLWPRWAGPRIVVAASEKADREIPAARRALWTRLVGRSDVEVLGILAGARAAAMVRRRQARYGFAMLALGGGTGVEHLAELYRARGRSVVPLDLQLGASREDGTGGAQRISSEARARPEDFVVLSRSSAGRAGSMLAAIATRGGEVAVNAVADSTLRLLESLAPPQAFYVRLLNRTHDAFPQVERFFREVVDTVVPERGHERREVGTDPSSEGFMNVEIFTRLHHADLVIADITGDRPNCFIELGYALRGDTPVLLTARRGTRPPFDGDKVPCHFWDPDRSIDDEREEFRAFWDRHYSRGPLVNAIELG